MKYAIDKATSSEITIYTEDGGAASVYHNGDRFITEYYQSRLSEISDDQWSEVYEGKIYCKEWPHKSFIDDEIVQDALRWLASSHIEFNEVELTNFNINK